MLVWWFALTACKVVDAPESLEELAVFAFVNLDERSAFVDEAADGLVNLIESDDGQIEQGYRVDSLTSAELALVGVQKDLENEVTGAAGQVRMTSSLNDVADVVTLPDLSPVFERTLRYSVTLDEESDRRCFLDRDCNRLAQTGSRENDQPWPIGETKQDFDQLFRWGETQDGRSVLLFRTLVPEETETSVGVVNLLQNYVLAAIWESEDGTARLEINWVDANVAGVEIPDSFALDQVVNAMQQQAEEIDKFVGGN
ncbi:MAG: hypothetical protein AAGA48_18280 [Myxococcota bacterium]